ncbi:MAG TPA: hypothetical protein VMV72_05285 [Verrucomicrobiae bacterium]|nr:hypothetical protein [Verrucomicrobiae bacterium]
MKSKADQTKMATTRSAPATELRIQADGTILTHNLTPAMAEMLSAVNPADRLMKQRARASQRQTTHELPART